MSIKPFSLGNIDMSEDPDAANEKLEQWLEVTMPEYLASPEHKKLSKINQKAAGEWFAMFMELYLNYIGQNLKDLDESAAREIMLDLIPRKVMCPDSQARKIVPDILACWQFLRRELNDGKRRTLKYADEVITFLESIKKDYLAIYKGHYQDHDEAELQLPFDLPFDLDADQLLEGALAPSQQGGYGWVTKLINDTARDFVYIRGQSEPPEHWMMLASHLHFAQFMQHICLFGFDENLPHVTDAVRELSSFALTQLFIQIRQGDPEAKDFWLEVEQNIQGSYEHDELKPQAMDVLTQELSHHKRFLSPGFVEFIHQWNLDTTPEMSPEEANPEALQALFMNMVDEVPDEFICLSLLKEQLGFLPPEALQLLGGLLMVTDSKAADALALLVLDDIPENARVIAETLATKPEVVTAKTLSRLIRIRNWLAPNVQKPVDKLIRDVRKKGIPPEAPEPISQKDILEIHMSGVDGSGAQGVMMMVRDGRDFRLISFVLKEAVGIVDVMVSPATTRGEVRQYLTMAKSQLGSMEKVSLSLIRQQLPFFIALNLQSKVAIDHELVQAMEMLGLEDWNPETADLSTLYNALLQSTPTQNELDAAQRRSRNWVSAAIGDSWFEMPDKLAPLRPLNSKNYHRVFEEIFEPARNQWGERMGRMALWCQGATNKRRQNQTRDFAMVSWLLNHSDLPVQDIDLIQAIAKNSV